MENVKRIIAVMLSLLVLFTAVSFIASGAEERENIYPPAETTEAEGFDVSMVEDIIKGIGINFDVDFDGIMDMYGRIMFTLQTLVDNILHFITENVNVGSLDLDL